MYVVYGLSLLGESAARSGGCDELTCLAGGLAETLAANSASAGVAQSVVG